MEYVPFHMNPTTAAAAAQMRSGILSVDPISGLLIVSLPFICAMLGSHVKRVGTKEIDTHRMFFGSFVPWYFLLRLPKSRKNPSNSDFVTIFLTEIIDFTPKTSNETSQ
eukprot:scaffold10199_cov146-Cylindrotheca_fusiformis.AAC.21